MNGSMALPMSGTTTAVHCPASGVQCLGFERPVVDQCVVVRFEQAAERWRELADVLVLNRQSTDRTAHTTATDALLHYPGCLAAVVQVSDRHLVCTRWSEVLTFPLSVPLAFCAQIVYDRASSPAPVPG